MYKRRPCWRACPGVRAVPAAAAASAAGRLLLSASVGHSLLDPAFRRICFPLEMRRCSIRLVLPLLSPAPRSSTSWRDPVSYTHLRAHESVLDLLFLLLLVKQKPIADYDSKRLESLKDGYVKRGLNVGIEDDLLSLLKS